jgi:hypothetical protein
MIKMPCDKSVWVSETHVVSVIVRTVVKYRDPLKETDPYTVWYLRVETGHDFFDSRCFDTEEKALSVANYIVDQVNNVVGMRWAVRFLEPIKEACEIYVRKEGLYD